MVGNKCLVAKYNYTVCIISYPNELLSLVESPSIQSHDYGIDYGSNIAELSS